MKLNGRSLKKFWRSTKALAVPVTFLILFVSMLCMISVTYYFAVEKVDSRTEMLKVSTAKQELQSFSQDIVPILWQPGSACTFEFSDSGGKLNVQPNSNILTVAVSGLGISSVLFNETVGQVTYELPYSGSAETGVYLIGDGRSIANQTGSVLTQLGIVNGESHPEIQLRYRPTVSYVTAGLEADKTVNNIRVYIVNLNASQEFGLYGKLPIKATCLNTQITTTTYTVDSTVQNLTLTATLDGNTGQVTIPIETTASGAIINIQLVESNMQIARCLR
ncbi:MAG: hypothetical protein ACFCUE_10070 [Candidatus Bathyarchaeia archaeon]|jgi:hypothetical protein